MLKTLLLAAAIATHQVPMDVYVMNDLVVDNPNWREDVRTLIEHANRRYQAVQVSDPAYPTPDFPCPFEIHIKKLEVFDGRDPKLQRRRGGMGKKPGLYLATGPGPAWSLLGLPKAYVWTGPALLHKKYGTSWRIAHEIGHTLGLGHIVVDGPEDACTMMSYGKALLKYAPCRKAAPAQRLSRAQCQHLLSHPRVRRVPPPD
ncbi:MAG: hypothetical protein GY725_03655 [bacterium]|nr:hypothetical protein [bacterium]